MNFDQSIRSAMRADAQPEALSSIIDQRIARYAHRRSVRRRVLWSSLATATAVAAFVLYPTISAQAALMRISGALDGVQQMVARRYNLSADGRKLPAGTVAYDHGRWRLEDPGEALTLFREGKRYRFDSFTKSFIVEAAVGPFSYNSDLHLSSIIAQVSAWRNNVEVRDAIVDGRSVIEAVATSRDLPERMTIVADAESKLPFRVLYDSKENGGWRRSSVMEIDYSVPTADPLFVPDPAIPRLSPDEWDKKVVETMLAKNFAEHPLRRGKLVIRAMDVAGDGTVFVAFQTGQYRGGFSGYAMGIQDDRGTPYTQLMMMNRPDSPLYRLNRAQGGPVEFAVFVPVSPSAWSPRSITLTAHIGDEGDLERMIEVDVVHPDGTTEARWQPNRWLGDKSMVFKDVPVMTRRLQRPDVQGNGAPPYMALAGFGAQYGPEYGDLSKVQARAVYFEKSGDGQREAFWLREELRLMSVLEAKGGGPYSRSSVLDRLATLDRANRE